MNNLVNNRWSIGTLTHQSLMMLVRLDVYVYVQDQCRDVSMLTVPMRHLGML